MSIDCTNASSSRCYRLSFCASYMSCAVCIWPTWLSVQVVSISTSACASWTSFGDDADRR